MAAPGARAAAAVSWVAHDLEPYALQKHFGWRLAIIPLILGSYAPDMLTKPFVYGVPFFGYELKAPDPEQFHRGWPGVGFTHSLAFGIVVAGLVYLVFRSKLWAIAFLIGEFAHVLTDIGDSVGVMLFFPFSTYHVSLGAWAYAAEHGRLVDGAAYFSGLGGVVWEGFWIVLCLLGWRMLKRDYFHEHVATSDAFFRWTRGRVPENVALAFYRTTYFWGVSRWFGWMIWAHVVNDYPIDLHWGGPAWVTQMPVP